MRVTRALRGLEVVLPHQPPHSLLRGAPPLNPQLRPHCVEVLAHLVTIERALSALRVRGAGDAG